MLTPRQIAEKGTFLVKEVGSSAHGTNIDTSSDRDLMGVCFQPAEYLLGLLSFDQYIYRTAEVRERYEVGSDQRKHGGQPPSQPGDTDLVIYSIQKYLRLAIGGNPSILAFLFSPLRCPEFEISYSYNPQQVNWGEGLENLAKDIASKQAGAKFLGYLRAQKERMLGQRGQMRVTRTHLIELYGYDVKYAMQAIRLGLQGIEFMNTGRLTLPMPVDIANSLKGVRRGELTFSEVIDWIDQLEEELKRAIDSSSLPRTVNSANINRWLVESQTGYFEWRQKVANLREEYLAKLP